MKRIMMTFIFLVLVVIAFNGSEKQATYVNNSNHRFKAPVNISNNSDDSRSPAIAADSVGNIDIAWTENFPMPYKSEVYFSRSTDGGVIWIKAVNISNNPETSGGTAIASDKAGNINVVWNNILSGKNCEIFFSRSTNHGVSWSQALNISNNPGWSMDPAITADSTGNIYAVWWYQKNIYFSSSLIMK